MTYVIYNIVVVLIPVTSIAMDFHTLVVGLLLVLTLLKALSARAKTRLPPGPMPLPLIGNLHLLGDKPHHSLAKLATLHGPLMCLRLGFINTVVVSSAALAREVLQKHDLAFSTRYIPDAINIHDHFKYSVVWLPVASRWRILRKVLNSSIFSVSRLDANQHLRSRKVQELVTQCRKNSENGEAVDVGRAAFRTSLNLLSNTIFSKDLADPFSDSCKEFKDLVCNIMSDAGKPNLVDFFPVLKKLDPHGIRRRVSINCGKLLDIFRVLIDERIESKKANHDENSDVIDVLLAISKENPDEIDRTHIEHLCLVWSLLNLHFHKHLYCTDLIAWQDLFVAGTDTTSNTVEWAMAEGLRNPEIMKKAKAELEEVLGRGKIVEEEDISRLPYLRCMVKETLRIHPPAPFLVPRRVEEDVELCGYIVPKNSQVFVNTWAIGRDPEIWTNPLEFKPERFLESEIDMRGGDFELIPFGAGRRICPGLPLAVRMMPVMLGSLLNSFDWKLLDKGIGAKELNNMDEKFGITLQKAQPLRAVPIPIPL